jgi:hypothetical protein
MRRRFGLLLSVVAALSLSALPTTAAAETTITGTGTFAITSDTVTSVTLADGNVFVVEELGGTIAGAMSGTFVVDDTAIAHPSGVFEIHGTFIFTGSVLGVGSGTFTAEVSDHGFGQGILSGELTLVSGTGDLSGLQGVVSFSSPPPTYSVMFVEP